MTWEVVFIDEAKRDMRKLDGSQQVLVLKASKKVQGNPTTDGPIGLRRFARAGGPGCGTAPCRRLLAPRYRRAPFAEGLASKSS